MPVAKQVLVKMQTEWERERLPRQKVPEPKRMEQRRMEQAQLDCWRRCFYRRRQAIESQLALRGKRGNDFSSHT